MLFENSIYLGLALVAAAALPAASLFQFMSPSADLIAVGGYASLFCMPIIVWAVVNLLGPTTRHTDRQRTAMKMAMAFSLVVFACAIDLIVSLENDGIISGYMAFYLKDAEPYLASDYSTAICYWDGIVHLILVAGILSSYIHNVDRFRNVSLFWFGSYVTSVIILLLGSLQGPHNTTWSITLNIPYLCVPVGHIMWIYSTQPSPQADRDFGKDLKSKLMRGYFILFFVCAILYAVLRLLAAMDVMRYGIDMYVYHVERHLHHPEKYSKVTAMMYGFYGIPFYVYAIKNLINNKISSTFSDLIMVHAGACANAQVGYLGGYFVRKGDEYKTLIYHKEVYYQMFFWAANMLLFCVPVLLALYNSFVCLEVEDPKREPISETRTATRKFYTRGKKTQ